MYNLNDIELSKQRREEVAQQVENSRLVRPGMTAGLGKVLLDRIFSWSPQKGQTAGC